MTSSNGDIFRVIGPCLTKAIWRCRKPFTQWQRSFQRKLRSHWLKFLRQRHVAVVWQGLAPLRGEFTGHRWMPHTKASDTELWCFFMICALNNGLSKHSWVWWFDMPMRSLWRHGIVATLFWMRLLIWYKGNTFGYKYVFYAGMLIFISTQVI